MSILRAESARIEICGHRGNSVDAPENTLAAFSAARRAGAALCETDVALSADGELVLIHDATVDRTTNGKGLVAAMSAADLEALDAGSWFDPKFANETIPTLRGALSFARAAGVRLQLELKVYGRDDELFPRLAAIIDETQSHDLVQFSSFDLRQLRDIRAEIPNVPTVGLSHSRLIDSVAMARAARVDAMNIEIQHFPGGEARELHDADIGAFLFVPRPAVIAQWTGYGVNLEARILEWIDKGLIDQLCGDDPGWLARLVGGEVYVASATQAA